MSKKALFLAAMVVFGGSSAALAQDVVIVPEQETVIHEYVKKKPLMSLDLPGVELNIGSPVPDTVVVHDIPDVKYRYAVVNKRTVIVDRDSGKIVKIYD